MFNIELTGIEAKGFHGVYFEERTNGQLFRVDLVLSVLGEVEKLSDQLANTVDYGELAQKVEELIAGEPVNLLETLALRIADLCLENKLVAQVKVNIYKPQAPLSVKFSNVSVNLTRRQSFPVVWSLGSNEGDRLANLQFGVDQLADLGQVKVDKISAVYETWAVESDPQPDFLNIIVCGFSRLPAKTLIERGLGIEAMLNRQRTVWHGPRPLDIDLIAYSDFSYTEQNCLIPHPRAGNRAFVLVPWLEVDPNAVLSGHGSVSELLANLDTTGVKLRQDLQVKIP